jgi:DNA-binding transcriptional LysR family regulator
MFRDLNDIRLFAAVARQGAVTRGADALGLPAATVSRRLAALERDIGARLIERNARRFKLTEAGRAYLAAATRVLEGIDAAAAEVSGLAAEPAGQLRIAAPTDFGSFFLAAPIAAFCARYPRISLSIDLSPRRVDLIDEDFDLAVRMGALQDSRLVSRRLIALRRGLYASREHCAGRPPPQTPEALQAARLIALDTDAAHGALSLVHEGAADAQREIALDGHLRVNTIAMLRELTLAGAGIALLPEAMLRRELDAGQIVRVLPDWWGPPIDAHLLYRGRALLPERVRAMVEHLIAWFDTASASTRA